MSLFGGVTHKSMSYFFPCYLRLLGSSFSLAAICHSAFGEGFFLFRCDLSLLLCIRWPIFSLATQSVPVRWEFFFLLICIRYYSLMSKRKRLDVKTKLEVLDFLNQPGATHEKAASAFSVARTTVSKIWKERNYQTGVVRIKSRSV